MQPLEGGHALFDEGPVILREISDRGFVSPDDFAVIQERAVVAAGLRAVPTSECVGELASKAFTSVVLPAPLRPINAIFSPRVTLAVKPRMTSVSP